MLIFIRENSESLGLESYVAITSDLGQRILGVGYWVLYVLICPMAIIPFGDLNYMVRVAPFALWDKDKD